MYITDSEVAIILELLDKQLTVARNNSGRRSAPSPLKEAGTWSVRALMLPKLAPAGYLGILVGVCVRISSVYNRHGLEGVG